MLCRSFFIGLFFIGILLPGFSQENSMNHFQRKGFMSQLVFPGEEFNSSLFTIPFPDSLYNSGSIIIKKMKINKCTGPVNFVFFDNRYTRLIYSVKKKNRDEFLKMLQQSNSSFDWKETYEKRRYVFILTLRK